MKREKIEEKGVFCKKNVSENKVCLFFDEREGERGWGFKPFLIFSITPSGVPVGENFARKFQICFCFHLKRNFLTLKACYFFICFTLVSVFLFVLPLVKTSPVLFGRTFTTQ